ncbi:MAG: LPS export ABC transporter periplasmic protein LptC [Gammaproteobacteria bacterium 28-57-27]|nr:MAG: LPS export ABC transporter periplasmic protein LptC [Gammaproteobacteria bacterium 28-57-27]
MIKRLPWLALLALAALSTWASFSLYRPLPGAEKRQAGADHAFIQPDARVFDKDGQAAYDLRGTRLEHRAESDELILTQAKMRLYAQDTSNEAPENESEYWDIQAERARIMADREHVQLEGQVLAERGGVLPEQRITLHAQDVTLAHKAQTASSAQPVIVDGAHWQSQSSGFQADLSTEQLEQTGRVHDRYQPPQP